ncbi:PAS domain S-box protein [Halomonas alkaliantarctica]|nr:PAS domain S-box protein [Halomonas alkaliantarctica]
MNCPAPNALSLEKQFSLRDLFDLSDALVVTTDTNYRVVYVNPAFCEMSGYSASEVIHKTPRYWSSEYTSQATRQRLNVALQQNRAWAGIFVNQSKDGTLWREQRTVQPLFDRERRVTGYLSVGFPVNEYERHVMRLSTLESQYTLIAAAAHELNNMLGVVTGLTEVNQLLLAESTEDSALATNLQAVLRAGQQAKTLVKRLRRGGAKTQPVYRTLDLTSLLSDMRPLLNKTLPQRVDLHFQLPGQALSVTLDESYLLLALTNLLKNAGEATSEVSWPKVRVALRSSEDGKEAVLSVQDNGCGMSDEAKEHFMEPFVSTKKASGGTGLGMLQVKELLSTHGGEFDVESALGAGTTITLRLPLTNAIVGKDGSTA